MVVVLSGHPKLTEDKIYQTPPKSVFFPVLLINITNDLVRFHRYFHEYLLSINYTNNHAIPLIPTNSSSKPAGLNRAVSTVSCIVMFSVWSDVGRGFRVVLVVVTPRVWSRENFFLRGRDEYFNINITATDNTFLELTFSFTNVKGQNWYFVGIKFRERGKY